MKKNMRKQTIVRIKKYWEWHFWTFRTFTNSKVTPKTHKRPKLKNM